MTISTTVRKAGPFVGNGVTTTFAFAFKCFATTDPQVLLNSSGAVTTAVLGTDYSVSLNTDQDNNPGGMITYPLVGSPMPSTTSLTIQGNLPATQATSIVNQSGFYPKVITDRFDYLTILIQQLLIQIGLVPMAAVADTVTPNLSLGTAAQRANSYLSFDASGNATFSVPTATAITLQQVANYGTDSGAVNAGVITVSTAFNFTLTTGTTVRFKAAATNTGAATLNINATGVKAVVNAIGNALTGGELSSTGYNVVQWNGTQWQLLSADITPNKARTAIEVTKAATPTNYSYDPGYIERFGAVSDNVTNDSTAVGNAIAAAAQSTRVVVTNDTYVGTARLANIDGVRFNGPGLVRYRPSSVLGNRVQNPAGREGPVWGAEYLFAFLNLVTTNSATTVRMTGDSTTAGGYSIQLQSILKNVPNCTVTIAGQSGKSSADWISTYLAADVAAAPTLLIWHWGMNDAATGVGTPTTMAQFESNLRSGLTTYRASVPIGTGGIILMTPNSCSDGTNGRDEYRNEKMRQIIRNAAEDFQCAFFDTYQLFQDGYVGIGSWLDNTYGDGLRGIHPQQAFSQAIAGAVYDLMIPKGLQILAVGFGVTQGTSVSVNATDAMSTYPLGVSIKRAAAANGFPLDGWVITFRESGVGTSCFQLLYQYNTDQAQQVRTWNSIPAAWSTWKNVEIPCVPANNRFIDNSATTAGTIGAGHYWTWFETNTAAAAFAITLPAPVDGEIYSINFHSATGAISWVATAPATNVSRLPTAALPASGSYRVIYNSGNTAWYPY